MAAVYKGFTLACVFIWEVRPSLTYTGHGHGLSTLTCFFSSLLNIHFQEGFWAIGCWVFSSFVSWGTLFGRWCCSFSSSLFWLILWICGTGRAQHLPSGWDFTLTTAMPTWRFWPHLPKALRFADDILKVPTLSFQLPKGYFKWNKNKNSQV